MARLNDDRSFETEEEARTYARDYLAQWGGQFSPYEGRVQVLPPNHDRSRWLVIASRNSSAD